MAKTLREDPADAETISHRLLVRAGYVRRSSAGVWTWLPLGKRVLENVSRIVREEMDGIGAQEVLLPALLPKEPYEVSGRWSEYGDLLFRLRDRKGADYLLGPTHEEIFTLLVKDQCTSYKDLPVMLYQIQTKYRDEARPRSGVLRGREFQMKDSYSFDVSDEGLEESYRLHREAYVRIFERLGLDHRIVSAVSGAMGGSASEEFLAPAPAGEDTFADCPSCSYAANSEAVTFPLTPVAAEHPALEEVDTPDTPTIETLAAHLGVPASATLKNLLVKVDGEIVAVGVPGDREVDLGKLGEHLAPAVVELVTAEDFEGRTDLVRGYVGPQGLEKVRYLADPRVAPGTAWVTGANRADTHARNVVCGRDFEVDQYLDVVVVEPGDPCPSCGSRPAARPGDRDRAHLPAGPQVRRRLRARRAGPRGQAGPGDHGLVRHRRLARRGRAGRADGRRARAVLARGGRPGRRPRGRGGQGGPAGAGGGGGHGPGLRGPAGPAGRPSGPVPGREADGRGADRRPVDPGGGPPLGRIGGRAAEPRNGHPRGAPAGRGPRPPDVTCPTRPA